jgi:predicted dehydrogenase
MNTPVRLALVGLGSWGRTVVEATINSSKLDWGWVYSRTQSTRQAFAEKYNSRPAPSYEAILEDPSVEGVVLMTPNDVHREQVLAAASHHKAVLVDKPIANTLQDASDIVAGCDQANVTLAVGHQLRHHHTIRHIKSLLDSGELGTPITVEANVSSARGYDIVPDEWRWSRERCPGGPLIQLVVHYTDILQYLLGSVERVMGWQRHRFIEAPIDDVTGTMLEFECGVLGHISSSYAVDHSYKTLTLRCSKASVHFDEDTGLTLMRGVKRQHIPLPKSTMHGMVLEEIEEFADCIRFGKVPDVGGREATRALAVVVAALRSQQEGKAICIEDILALETNTMIVSR